MPGSIADTTTPVIIEITGVDRLNGCVVLVGSC
jgi:hypothetical protein